MTEGSSGTYRGSDWSINATWELSLALAKYGSLKEITKETDNDMSADKPRRWCISSPGKWIFGPREKTIKEALHQDIRSFLREFSPRETKVSDVSDEQVSDVAERLLRKANLPGEVHTEKAVNALILGLCEDSWTAKLAKQRKEELEKTTSAFLRSVDQSAADRRIDPRELMDKVHLVVKASENQGGVLRDKFFNVRCRFSLPSGEGEGQEWDFNSKQLRYVVRDKVVERVAKTIIHAPDSHLVELRVPLPTNRKGEDARNKSATDHSRPNKKPTTSGKNGSPAEVIKRNDSTQRNINEQIAKGRDYPDKSSYPSNNDRLFDIVISLKTKLKRYAGLASDDQQKIHEELREMVGIAQWQRLRNALAKTELSHDRALFMVTSVLASRLQWWLHDETDKRPSVESGLSDYDQSVKVIQEAVEKVLQDLHEEESRSKLLLTYYAQRERSGIQSTTERAEAESCFRKIIEVWARKYGLDKKELQNTLLNRQSDSESEIEDTKTSKLYGKVQKKQLMRAAASILEARIVKHDKLENISIEDFLARTEQLDDRIPLSRRIRDALLKMPLREAKNASSHMDDFAGSVLANNNTLGGARTAAALFFLDHQDISTKNTIRLSTAALILKKYIRYQPGESSHKESIELADKLGAIDHFVSEWTSQLQPVGGPEEAYITLNELKLAEKRISLKINAAVSVYQEFEKPLYAPLAPNGDWHENINLVLKWGATLDKAKALEEEFLGAEVLEAKALEEEFLGAEVLEAEALEAEPLDEMSKQGALEWAVHRWATDKLLAGYIGAKTLGYSNELRKVKKISETGEENKERRKALSAQFESAADIEDTLQKKIIDCTIKLWSKEPLRTQAAAPRTLGSLELKEVLTLTHQARYTEFMRRVVAAVEAESSTQRDSTKTPVKSKWLVEVD